MKTPGQPVILGADLSAVPPSSNERLCVRVTFHLALHKNSEASTSSCGNTARSLAILCLDLNLGAKHLESRERSPTTAQACRLCGNLGHDRPILQGRRHCLVL